MMRNLFVCVVGLALGLGACGSVESNGGNDIPSGPAVPTAASASACTHDGSGINAVVMPVFSSGTAAQGTVNPSVPDGIDTSVPICYDFQAQAPTAGAVALTQMSFTIKDGVLQAPPAGSVVIVSQWFEWNAPDPTDCLAVVFAVVNVTVGSMPTCSATLQFGDEIGAAIGTYAISGS